MQKPYNFNFDYLLLMIVILLLLLGLVMITSASINVAERSLHHPFYYCSHQLVYLCIAVVVSAVIFKIPTALLEHASILVLLLALGLLCLVLVPGIGHMVNGSMRWLGFGLLRLQVSEFAKLALVLYFAAYLWRHNNTFNTSLSGFIKPLGILGVFAVLLLLEPDFGDLVVIELTAFSMMFLAGLRLRYFFMFFGGTIAGMAALAVAAPYRLLRLTAFLHPWDHQFDSGYQLTQALIAFGRGGWFGVGLGKSIQKLFYLPESHTDFVFAVITEELGLAGAVTLVLLFAVLCVRILYIGRAAQLAGRHFAGLLSYGCAGSLMIQATVNIGVNIGLLPTKGLTLPFISYGGSSLLVACMMVAMVLRIDADNRLGEAGR